MNTEIDERVVFEKLQREGKTRNLRKIRSKMKSFLERVYVNDEHNPLGFVPDSDQQKLIKSTSKNIICPSVAGSGKSEALRLRLYHMIGVRGIEPSSILCISYCRKTRGVLVDKFCEVNEGNEFPVDLSPLILTFHSFASKVIRKEVNIAIQNETVLSNTRKVNFIEESDMEKELKRIQKIFLLNDVSLMEMKRMLRESRWRKNRDSTFILRNLQNIIFTEYEKFLEAKNSASRLKHYDYFGLILKLKEGDFSFNLDSVKHIIVDEAQDTDEPTLSILDDLFNFPSVESMVSVGHKDQNIYGFSGLSLKDFERSFSAFSSQPSDVEIIRIRTNYRCHPNICIGSDALIFSTEKRSGYSRTKQKIGPDFEHRIFCWTSYGEFMVEDQYEILNAFIPKFIEKGLSHYIMCRRNLEIKSLLSYASKKNWGWIDSEKVEIMTMHSGKGGETDIAWLLNVVEMNIPLIREIDANSEDNYFGETLEELEERELRLYKLAVERARDLVVNISPTTVKNEIAFKNWTVKSSVVSDFVKKMGKAVAYVYNVKDFMSYPRNYLKNQ